MRSIRLALLAGLLAGPAPAWAQRIVQVRATPSRAILGETQQVRITVAGAPGLRATANVGSVSAVSGGRATYTPPGSGPPQVAVILVYGDGVAGAVAIPLWGRTELPVRTEPEATVTLEAGALRFGPVRADSSGHATVPLKLPPGIRSGTLVARDRAGHETRRTVSLGAHDNERTVSARTTAQLPAGGEERATVAFAAASADARLLAGTQVSTDDLEIVSQQAGTGVLVAEVRAKTRAGRMPVHGSFAGARATVAIHVEPGPPERIDITSDPPRVPADGRTKPTVRASVVDRHGNALPVEPPRLFVEGVRVEEEEREGGTATAILAARSLGDYGAVPEPARIRAEGSGLTGELVLRWLDPDAIEIEVAIEPDRFVAGDVDIVTLRIEARDGLGRPPGEQVLLVEAESLRLQSRLRHRSGSAATKIRPGTKAGRHVVRVEIGDWDAETMLEILPAAPVRVRARFDPARVPPGAESELRVEVLDRWGNVVGGHAPTTRVEGLVLGEFEARGDGSVATVRVPGNAPSEPVTVEVEAAGLRGRARLEVVGASTLYVGAAAGLSQNLGALLSVPVALDLGWRPPFVGRPTSVGIEARFAAASGEGDLAGDAENRFETRHLVLQMAGSHRWAVGPIEPFGELAGGIAFASSKVTPTVGAIDRRSGTAPSLELGGGAELPLGPGRARAALRFGYLPLPEPLEGNATGLLLLVGYRLDL